MKLNPFFSTSLVRVVMLILLVGTLSSCNSSNQNTFNGLKLDPTNDSLTLPEGFGLEVVAEVGKTRHIFVRDNGDIYINRGTDKTDKKDSALVALRDTDGDGKADVINYFDRFNGTGIAINDGYLCASSRTEVFRYNFNGNELLSKLPKDTLISAFQKDSDCHPKGFTFNNAGYIYVNVGAPSNACEVQFRTPHSLGKDPCFELELNAGIWRFKKDILNQKRGKSGERYATGIRNAMGLDWSEANGGMFAMTHGRDAMTRKIYR